MSLSPVLTKKFVFQPRHLNGLILRVLFFQKKNKKDEKSERRPFDREIDLQVNRFDEAQKKSIIKKAQQLDTRFGAGKSKYL